MSRAFQEFFRVATGFDPLPYQARLATTPDLPQLLEAATGAGKTAAVVLAFLWRVTEAGEDIWAKTPLRLVYALPMRSLVEQTYAEVQSWIEKLGLGDTVGVYLLMGGAIENEWQADAEKPCILIGTQDQLLSRALNRGYGMSRNMWPVHFALLNNDCLWVLDETQLMGIGLLTAAQLQGFREKLQSYGLTHSLFMSATLDTSLLATVDFQPDFSIKLGLDDEDTNHPELRRRLNARKRLTKAKTVLSGAGKDYAKSLADEVKKVHQSGKLTLVIVNRVDRAQAVYQVLSQKLPEEQMMLIHSRFRGKERQELNQKLRDRSFTGIIVATQAIEAGVDISALNLFTELAPWSSMVQRFGRCNRYGLESEAAVYWIDIVAKKQDQASPYKVEELDAARKLLELQDVSPANLTKFLKSVDVPKQSVEGLIPRKQDLLDLFDTTPDLEGHDIDISQFIRNSHDTDVAIAWRNWEGEAPDENQGALQRDELCRVNVWRAKEFIKGKKAWYWNPRDEKWESVQLWQIRAGMQLLIRCCDGGYSEKLGFTGGSEIPEPLDLKSVFSLESDDSNSQSFIKQFVTLKKHAQDVAEEATNLCTALSQRMELPVDLLIHAARWHDLGKAHEVFQEMMVRHDPEREAGKPWAKSDNRNKPNRKGFRHELGSALVALHQNEDFLLAYLVAAHHGQVRMHIRPRAYEKPPKHGRYALGFYEGDCIPATDLGAGLKTPEVTVSLACMELGGAEAGKSWTEQAQALLHRFGPFQLAFLESIIRIADWRGSRKEDLADG